MAKDLPPVPYGTPISGDDGLVSPAWADWCRKLFLRVGGNINKSSLAASGYQQLGSGLYIQWGVTASILSGVNSTITFPIAFPAACFQVLASIRDNSADVTTGTGHVGTGGYTASNFGLYNRTSSAYVFNWVAIGN